MGKFSLGNLGGTIKSPYGSILRFKYVRDNLTMLEVINITDGFIPPEFSLGKVDERLLRLFFYHRIVPSTRIGIDEELAKTPIQYYDPERIIRYQKGTCVDDVFWLESDDDNTCWN